MTARFVVLAGLIACAPVPEPSLPGVIAKCPAAFCGGNSPEIDHYGLHELGLDHQINSDGFELLGASMGNEAYSLAVVDSTISAIGASKELRGSDLTGLTLWLRRGKQQYGVVIDGVGRIAEVVDPYRPLETYVLDWSEVVAAPLRGPVPPGSVIEAPRLGPIATPVCPEPGPWDPNDAEWDESIAMAPYDSIVFEGDRIDATHRTVDARPDDRWFNVGCARHTLAKLRLTRNTLHTVASGDWRQVQATIKMLSADYCGTGDAFTVAGQPIVWHNQVGMDFWAKPQALEARWNEGGAICLDTPRVAGSQNAAAIAAFPDVETAIAAACTRPPPCKQPDPTSFSEPDELITTGTY